MSVRLSTKIENSQNFSCYRLGEEWRAIARAPQHAPKIILGAELLHTLDIKIARLVLIFNLVLVLHAPRPLPLKKKRFIITHFETSFLLLSKYALSLAPWK